MGAMRLLPALLLCMLLGTDVFFLSDEAYARCCMCGATCPQGTYCTCCSCALDDTTPTYTSHFKHFEIRGLHENGSVAITPIFLNDVMRRVRYGVRTTTMSDIGLRDVSLRPQCELVNRLMEMISEPR
jgi:hypothetical protein